MIEKREKREKEGRRERMAESKYLFC